jgi:hypothetical protein
MLLQFSHCFEAPKKPEETPPEPPKESPRQTWAHRIRGAAMALLGRIRRRFTPPPPPKLPRLRITLVGFQPEMFGTLLDRLHKLPFIVSFHDWERRIQPLPRDTHAVVLAHFVSVYWLDLAKGSGIPDDRILIAGDVGEAMQWLIDLHLRIVQENLQLG